MTAAIIPADILAAIAAQSPSIENEAIRPEHQFLEDLGLDSLDLVEIVVTLEEKRGILVIDAVLERIQTVAQLVEAVTAAPADAVATS